MKRGKLTLVAVVLSGSLLFSSCVGSFSLFNRLSSWNQSVGNKFVNELVFLAFNIVPVYGVAYLADALVINSIEFWSGSNPMANVGDVKKVKGENGNYMVKTLENGYSITKEGETASMDLIYNKEANTWNVVANGESAELVKMNNDGTADLFLPNGEKMNVTLDAQVRIQNMSTFRLEHSSIQKIASKLYLKIFRYLDWKHLPKIQPIQSIPLMY